LYGIESGNQRILDYYNKGITIAQIEQAVKTANKARLDIILGSFIIGATDETLAEVINTIKFANKLDISFASFQILQTIPISPIYQELVERGFYAPGKDDWKKSMFVTDVSPKAVSHRVLTRLVGEGFTRFWSKPSRNFKFIWRSLFTDTYASYMIENMTRLRDQGGAMP